MRHRFMVGAAMAGVGLGAVAVFVAPPTAIDAANRTHSKITQLTWIGPHPDTSAAAPAGKQKSYVVDVKRNTIRYLGLTLNDQANLPAARIQNAAPPVASAIWTQARVDQAVARSAVPMAVVFDKQGNVLNVVPSRHATPPR